LYIIKEFYQNKAKNKAETKTFRRIFNYNLYIYCCSTDYSTDVRKQS